MGQQPLVVGVLAIGTGDALRTLGTVMAVLATVALLAFLALLTRSAFRTALTVMPDGTVLALRASGTVVTLERLKPLTEGEIRIDVLGLVDLIGILATGTRQAMLALRTLIAGRADVAGGAFLTLRAILANVASVTLRAGDMAVSAIVTLVTLGTGDLALVTLRASGTDRTLWTDRTGVTLLTLKALRPTVADQRLEEVLDRAGVAGHGQPEIEGRRTVGPVGAVLALGTRLAVDSDAVAASGTVVTSHTGHTRGTLCSGRTVMPIDTVDAIGPRLAGGAVGTGGSALLVVLEGMLLVLL